MTATAEETRLAATLAAFGTGPDCLIAAGGESRVYALTDDRVLRVLRRPQDPASLRRKQVFLDALDGRLPYATSRIEAIAPDGGWTIERRIPGTSLLVGMRELSGTARAAALTRYAEAVDALSSVTFPDRPYGQILTDRPVTATHWRDYLVRGLDGFIAANGPSIAGAGCDVEASRAKAVALLDGVAAMPAKALVHGDYFPGNVIMDGEHVSGLVDFSSWTMVGDPAYDAIGAIIFLEMMAESTADDVALVRDVMRRRHGAALDGPARFYRAYFPFAMADPTTAGSPYPRLWPWALENLAALDAGRIVL